MKKRNSILALLLILVTLLTACGAKTESAAVESPAMAPQYDMKYDTVTEEAPAEEAIEMELADIATSSNSGSSEAMSVEEVQTYAEKIIYSGYVNMETTYFDDAINALDRAVKEYGGFVQDSSVNGWSRDNGDGTFTIMDRSAHYVVRIPAAKFDAFMALTQGIGNVTSSSRNAENVTSQYTDYEARLSSLYTQEERLLAMLEKTSDLDSLITLESRLSEVRYEIESIERNLRNLDQKLSFSTVTLDIREVEVYTPTVTVQRTFGEKLADAFADGWSYFVRRLQRFVLWFAESLPSLILWAIILGGGVLLFLKGKERIRRKMDAKKQAKAPKKDEQEEQKP